MASVALDTVWLSLASDLTQSLQLEVSSLSDDDVVFGEVRRYAGGRDRSIVRKGRRRTFELSFDAVGNRAQIATLRGWTGLVVLLRDPFGRKAYCVFYGSPLSERIPVDMPEVSLTLSEVTVSEAV